MDAPNRTGIIGVALVCSLGLTSSCSSGPPSYLGPLGASTVTSIDLRVGQTGNAGFYFLAGKSTVRLLDISVVDVPTQLQVIEVVAVRPADIGGGISALLGPLRSHVNASRVHPVSDVILAPESHANWQVVVSFRAVAPGSVTTGGLRVRYRARRKLFTQHFSFAIRADITP